jgi:hypothetical protein
MTYPIKQDTSDEATELEDKEDDMIHMVSGLLKVYDTWIFTI